MRVNPKGETVNMSKGGQDRCAGNNFELIELTNIYLTELEMSSQVHEKCQQVISDAP